MQGESKNRGVLEIRIRLFVIFAILCLIAGFMIGFRWCPEAYSYPEINTTTDNLTYEPEILYQYIYTFPHSQLPEIKCEVCKCQN